MRRAAVLLLLLPVGCWKPWLSFTSNPIETPTPTPASEATAARVYEVGRKLLIANPFAGIEPGFQVVGHKDSLLFHRDLFSVFISDTLADRCRTEDELAGVLAHELGNMIAEKRSLARMGIEEPTAPKPAGEEATSEALAVPVGGTDAKAMNDKLRELPTDPKSIAAALLKDAGYPPAAQKSAESLLRSANRDKAILKQLAGPAATPKWSN